MEAYYELHGLLVELEHAQSVLAVGPGPAFGKAPGRGQVAVLGPGELFARVRPVLAPRLSEEIGRGIVLVALRGVRGPVAEGDGRQAIGSDLRQRVAQGVRDAPAQAAGQVLEGDCLAALVAERDPLLQEWLAGRQTQNVLEGQAGERPSDGDRLAALLDGNGGQPAAGE